MTNTTTIERPVIEIPREEGESARAHAAKVEYILAGPERSLDKILERVQSEYRSGIPKRRATLGEWSSRFDWQGQARRYDEMIIQMRTQEATEQYRRDLEDHRKRYGDAGKALYQVAAKLLKQLDAIAGQPPQTIKGADGKTYKIPGIELTPATLTTASRAMTIAADLEAHALRLGDVLPRLDTGDE